MKNKKRAVLSSFPEIVVGQVGRGVTQEKWDSIFDRKKITGDGTKKRKKKK